MQTIAVNSLLTYHFCISFDGFTSIDNSDSDSATADVKDYGY